MDFPEFEILPISDAWPRPKRGWGVPPGSRRIQDGYVALKIPDWHPLFPYTNKGWITEHRYVMAKSLGRRLAKGENVHHKNGLTTDNDLDNLELWITSQPAGQRANEKKHCASCTCFHLL